MSTNSTRQASQGFKADFQVRTPDRPRRNFRGQSPEERQAERRTRLVEAGLEAFGTRGFHAVGVRDICAEAHLTERYFYESFRNLEALFLAVYDHAVATIRTAIVASLASTGPGEEALTRRSLRAYLETLRKDPRLARVALVEVMSVGSEVGNQSLVVSQSFVELVVTLIDGLYPDAQGEGHDRRLVATGLVGSTILLVMQWAIGGFEESTEVMLDHCALFYDALEAVLARPASTEPV